MPINLTGDEQVEEIRRGEANGERWRQDDYARSLTDAEEDATIPEGALHVFHSLPPRRGLHAQLPDLLQ